VRLLGLTRARLPGAGGGLRPYRALQFLTYAFSPQVDHEQGAGEWHVIRDVDAQRTHVHASSIPMDAQESSSGFRVRSIWPRQEEESALPNLKRSCEVRRRERSCIVWLYYLAFVAVLLLAQLHLLQLHIPLLHVPLNECRYPYAARPVPHSTGKKKILTSMF
jgi:hypothetical protein